MGPFVLFGNLLVGQFAGGLLDTSVGQRITLFLFHTMWIPGP